jgi:hypothetical protein
MAEGLAAAVRDTGREVHVVGDCVSPRSIEVAIAEAALAARGI